MRPRLLLPILAIVALVFGALPPASAREVFDFPVTWSAPERVVVPMKLRNGIPIIPCTVNGTEVWMILDTGSEKCVLEAEAAAKAGVRVIDRINARVEMEGTHGKEIAGVGIPATMAIGTWRWQGLPCVVRAARGKAPPVWLYGQSMSFNILGADALQAMCSYVTIDYPRRVVVFGFKKAFRPRDGAVVTQQSCQLRAGVPFVTLTHAGRQWSALVDTGASSKLELNQGTFAQLGLRNKTRWVEGVHLGLGGTTGVKRGRFQMLVLPSVACLGRDWPKAEAMLVENESKIGSGLCLASRLTIDFAQSRIWVETTAPRAR